MNQQNWLVHLNGQMCKCGDRQPVDIFEEPVIGEDDDAEGDVDNGLEYFEPPIVEEMPSVVSISTD